MEINSIESSRAVSPINQPGQATQKIEQTTLSTSQSRPDSINISASAQRLAETSKSGESKIQDSEQAQQALKAIQEKIQSSPAQALGAQANTNTEMTRAVLG